GCQEGCDLVLSRGRPERLRHVPERRDARHRDSRNRQHRTQERRPHRQAEGQAAGRPGRRVSRLPGLQRRQHRGQDRQVAERPRPGSPQPDSSRRRQLRVPRRPVARGLHHAGGGQEVLRRILVVLMVVLPLQLAAAPAAMADDPVTCTPPNQFNPITKRCTISVGDGGENGGGDTPPGDTGGENSGGGGSNGPARCEVGNYGYGDLGVVTGLAAPQPPGNDPVWEGHYPDGAIYKCEGTPGVGGGRIGVPPLRLFWAATPPNAPPPPDPEDLAREAIAQMQLSPIQIGIVPEDAPGRIGVVGMPTYRGAENPGQNPIGPT